MLRYGFFLKFTQAQNTFAPIATLLQEHRHQDILCYSVRKESAKLPWCGINEAEVGVGGRPLRSLSHVVVSWNALKRAVTQNQHALKTLLGKMLLAQLPLFLHLFLLGDFQCAPVQPAWTNEKWEPPQSFNLDSAFFLKFTDKMERFYSTASFSC